MQTYNDEHPNCRGFLPHHPSLPLTIPPYLQLKPQEKDPALAAGPAPLHHFIFEGRRIPYYSRVYKNGDICDLTKQPRETEVRFTCAEEESGNGLVEISETSTCRCVSVKESRTLPRGFARLAHTNRSSRYLAVVALPQLCANSGRPQCPASSRVSRFLHHPERLHFVFTASIVMLARSQCRLRLCISSYRVCHADREDSQRSLCRTVSRILAHASPRIQSPCITRRTPSTVLQPSLHCTHLARARRPSLRRCRSWSRACRSYSRCALAFFFSSLPPQLPPPFAITHSARSHPRPSLGA